MTDGCGLDEKISSNQTTQGQVEKTYKLSRTTTTSKGARAEAPGKDIGLTSADTCTVVHRDTGSVPIWDLLAVDRTFTNATGRSIGHRELKFPWSAGVTEECSRSVLGCAGPSERLELDDGDSGNTQEPELQRRTNCGAGPYL